MVTREKDLNKERQGMKSYHCICHTCRTDCVISAPESAPRLLLRVKTSTGITPNQPTYDDVRTLKDTIGRVIEFYDGSPHGAATREIYSLLFKLSAWQEKHKDHKVVITDNPEKLVCDVSSYSGESLGALS